MNDYLRAICLLLLLRDFSSTQSRIDKFLTSVGLEKLLSKHWHKKFGSCIPITVHGEVEINYFFYKLIKVFHKRRLLHFEINYSVKTTSYILSNKSQWDVSGFQPLPSRKDFHSAIAFRKCF